MNINLECAIVIYFDKLKFPISEVFGALYGIMSRSSNRNEARQFSVMNVDSMLARLTSCCFVVLSGVVEERCNALSMGDVQGDVDCPQLIKQLIGLMLA